MRRLVDSQLEAGRHTSVWEGRDDRGRRLASGVYFPRLVVDGRTRVERVTLLK